jgi:hypothetical protein
VADTVDADELTARLYSSAPEDFVKVRGEGSRTLKAAGDSEAAADFARLAKPSLSAWAVNLLVARRAQVLDEVIDRGEALRAAHTRGGDAKQIRAAHQARQDSIRRATDAAVELTGRKVSESHREEVSATLEAASADPEAADEVRAGRLVRPLAAPTGFGTLGGLTVLTGDRARAGARQRTQPAADAGDRIAGTDDEEEEEAGNARLAMLRADADAAAQVAESARRAAAELGERVASLEEDRSHLQDELQRLDQQLTAVRREAREAERAAADAERKANRAATRAERAGT